MAGFPGHLPDFRAAIRLFRLFTGFPGCWLDFPVICGLSGLQSRFSGYLPAFRAAGWSFAGFPGCWPDFPVIYGLSGLLAGVPNHLLVFRAAGRISRSFAGFPGCNPEFLIICRLSELLAGFSGHFPGCWPDFPEKIKFMIIPVWRQPENVKKKLLFQLTSRLSGLLVGLFRPGKDRDRE
jgi:hypothetical protein